MHTHMHMHTHTHTQTVDMISAHRVTGHDTRDLRKVQAIVALQKRGNAVLSEILKSQLATQFTVLNITTTLQIRLLKTIEQTFAEFCRADFCGLLLTDAHLSKQGILVAYGAGR